MFGIADYDELVADDDRPCSTGWPIVDDDAQMARLTTIFERSTAVRVAFWDMVYGGPRRVNRARGRSPALMRQPESSRT